MTLVRVLKANNTRRSPGTMAVITLTFFTALATVSGFFREIVVANFYGTSADADAIAIILFYYDSLYVLIISGVAGLTIIPYLSKMRERGEENKGIGIVITVSVLLSILAAIFSIIVFVNATDVTRFLLPTLESGSLQRVSGLIQYTALGAAPLIIANIFLSLLQAFYQFNLIPYARIMFNICVIASAIIAYQLNLFFIISFGIIGGILGQLFLSIINIKKLRPHRVRLKFMHPELLAFLRLMLIPVLIYLIASFLYGSMELYYLSSLGAGKISGVKYAYRVLAILGGFSTSLQIVFFARSGREANSRSVSLPKFDLFEKTILRGFIILLPISTLFFLLAHPLAKLLFERGAFQAVSTLITGSSIEVYAFTVTGSFLLGIVMRYGFLINVNWLALLMIVVYFLLGMAIIHFIISNLGYLAIPVANVIATWVTAFAGLLLLCIRIRKMHVIQDAALSLLKVIILCTVSSAPALLVRDILAFHLSGNILEQIAYLLTVGLVFFSVYLLLGMLLNINGLRQEVLFVLKELFQ